MKYFRKFGGSKLKFVVAYDIILFCTRLIVYSWKDEPMTMTTDNLPGPKFILL